MIYWKLKNQGSFAYDPHLFCFNQNPISLRQVIYARFSGNFNFGPLTPCL